MAVEQLKLDVEQLKLDVEQLKLDVEQLKIGCGTTQNWMWNNLKLDVEQLKALDAMSSENGGLEACKRQETRSPGNLRTFASLPSPRRATRRTLIWTWIWTWIWTSICEVNLDSLSFLDRS